MQVQNKANANYVQVLPDGTINNLFAESNVVETNLVQIPPAIVVPHERREVPFWEPQQRQNSNPLYFYIFSLILKRYYGINFFDK